MVVVLDLMSYRCPTMQSKLNRGLMMFSQSANSSMVIKCIDPRFEANLEMYLSMQDEMANIKLVEKAESPLTEEEVTKWKASGHMVDKADIEGIAVIKLALLKKINIEDYKNEHAE